MPNVARREDLASLADYPALLARVRETFVLGQQKAEELKVQTYWEAGRLIHEHLRHHQDEAGYGKQLARTQARQTWHLPHCGRRRRPRSGLGLRFVSGVG